jgi:CheY-like chemotaxis protein/transcriptional regulator with XRE-family HTH domain
MAKRKIETRGATIRAARLRAGLTQRELVAKSGVGLRTIQDMEKGIGAQAFFIDCVASALGLSRSDLFQPLDHKYTQAREPLPGVALTEENQATYGFNTVSGELHARFDGIKETPEAVKQLLSAVSVMLDHISPELLEFRYMRRTESLSIGIKLPIGALHDLVQKLISGELDRIPLDRHAIASIDEIHIPAATLAMDPSESILRSQLQDLAWRSNSQTTVTFQADGSAIVERHLGLAVARESVERHGGTIEPWSSDSDIGSGVTGPLPMSHSQPEEPEPGPTPVRERPGSEAKHRILVVERDPQVAMILATVLRRMGHFVEIAHNGLRAVRTAALFQPDIVLLALNLRRMDGYEAMKRIREQTSKENIVIIAMTEWGRESDKWSALAAGFDHCLTMPVEPSALERLFELLHD